MKFPPNAHDVQLLDQGIDNYNYNLLSHGLPRLFYYPYKLRIRSHTTQYENILRIELTLLHKYRIDVSDFIT